MSQHDLVIANQSFPATRTDLNAAILAVASNSSGATEPTTTYANQWWYETDTNILKIRNEANDDWVNVITLDESMTASASDLNLLNTANRGAAGTVLTSDGTDLSWATAGGFAGSTVAVTANTTLTSGQSGNLIRVTATGSKVITLPAVANGLFYVFSSESASEMYIKANGSNTINGSNAGVKLKLAAGASGIISCGTAGTNWSSVGITRNMIVHKSTTFYNNNDANAGNSGDATRVTGTYTTTLGTQILICVGSATPSAPYGAGSNSTNRSAGAPGQSYGEKFISSPASTYAYEICGGGDVSGASTGGFTDVLLTKGAERVYAVDVGHGQLDWKLRQDSRVIVKEKTNARYLSNDIIKEPLDAIVCDASFISLKKILPAGLTFLKNKGWLAALIKPQFEAGRELVGKGGVVRDAQVHQNIINDIECWIKDEVKMSLLGVTESPILGPSGNKEFVIVATKK